MRIHFVNSSVPTRAARRLMKSLNLPESTAFAWTAYVFGYRNWQELHRVTGTTMPSPFDEDCSAEEVAARRRYQVQRLGECLAANRGRSKSSDPATIVAEWKPSSACRPEPSRFSFNLNLPQRALTRVALRMMGVEEPVPLKRLPRDLVRDVPESLRQNMHKDSMCMAKRLIRHGTPDEQAFSRSILQYFHEQGNVMAALELARSYALGAGGVADTDRARVLYDQAMRASAGDVAITTFAKEGLSSLDGHGEGWPEDVQRASTCWEKKALDGDEEAAFRVALMCDPCKPLYREVPAEPQKSVRFYRLAASTGHRRATANLAAILAVKPELADYFSEPKHWLEMASYYGDSAAKALESTISKHLHPVLAQINVNADERDYAYFLDHVPESERGNVREVPGLGDVVAVPPHRLLQLSTGHIYKEENGQVIREGNDRVAESIIGSYPRSGTPFEKAAWVSDMAELFGTVDRFITGRKRTEALEAS